MKKPSHTSIQSKTLSRKQINLFIALLLVIWLAQVIYTTANHEFWRDEVRALSLARQTTSIFNLYNVIHFEGHPALWYVLLFIGSKITASPLVLPILSISIAAIAVAVFMFYAPFPLWLKTIFLFSLIPAYEYSVMARNYGLTMLFLFLSALCYRSRDRHPYLLAVSLALLANTTSYAAVMAGLLLFIWTIDRISKKEKSTFLHLLLSTIIPFLIVLLGIGFCLIFVLPDPKSILIDHSRTTSLLNLLEMSLRALVRPDLALNKLFFGFFPSWLVILIVVISLLGLARAPVLLISGIVYQTVFGVMYSLSYGMSFRQEALFVVFMLTLYWFYFEEKDLKFSQGMEILNKIGLIGGMGIFLFCNIFSSYLTIQIDLINQLTSSKEFGTFLRDSSKYKDAILVGEPDFLLESIPYYASNEIYIPREKRFGTTVSWTTDAASKISLGEVLEDAEEIKAEYHRPVLIVLGFYSLDGSSDGSIPYSYNKVFTWTHDEFIDFHNSTTLVGEYTCALTDENYYVYEVK